MTFLQAKSLLRQHGYSISRQVCLPGYPTQYVVWRIANNNGKPEAKQFRLTAEDIKAGVFRAMTLAQGVAQ